MQLIGYHGTSEDGCKGILRDKRFKCSTGNSQWLGDGVYFFQDDRHQAYMFFKISLVCRMLEDMKKYMF